MKRDRFELLSAYLDGEVTPEERQLVLNWMRTDPSTKRLYNRLVQIRQGMQTMSTSNNCDFEDTLAGVFHCLGRRFQMVGMASAGVVVLGMLGMLSGSLSSRHMLWQWAMVPGGSSTHAADSLQVALDQPVFPIPKAPTATVSVNQTSAIDSGLWPSAESEL